MERYVIIVAGGIGKRFGADIPKQFVYLAGKPILLHTLEKFYGYLSDMKIVVVLPQEQIEAWNNICTEFGVNIPHQVVAGGSQRFFSVKNGLSLVPDGALVAIHDGVRPFVSFATLERTFVTAEQCTNAVPVIPVSESVRLCDGANSSAFDRNKIKIVQTPQIFHSTILKKAYNQPFTELFTDDASVVEAMGEQICLVEGNTENIKITTPFDLVVGEAIFAKENKS